MSKTFEKCIGCQERHIGCHSSCEFYKAEKTRIAKENEIVNKKKNAIKEYIEYKTSVVEHMRRKHETKTSK